LQVNIFSIMSCNASTDFIEWCSQQPHIAYFSWRIYDPQHPTQFYHYTLEDLERIYDRRFYRFPIIYINGEYYSSIQDAKERINEH